MDQALKGRDKGVGSDFSLLLYCPFRAPDLLDGSESQGDALGYGIPPFQGSKTLWGEPLGKALR